MENQQLTINKTSGTVGFVEKMLSSIESLEKAKEFGVFIINSGYAPVHFKDKPESIILAIDAGKKIGLDWFQSLQEGYIVNGIPGYKGKILKALVQASPVCELWETSFVGSLEKGDLTCKIRYKRRGSEAQERSFGVDNAKMAGLWGKKKKYDKMKNAWVEYEDSWCKYPQDMLEWKCVARVLNDFADITKGFRPVEDLQDYRQDEEIIATTKEGIVITNPTKENKSESIAQKARTKIAEEPIQEAQVVSELPFADVVPGGEREFNECLTMADYMEEKGFDWSKVESYLKEKGIKEYDNPDNFYKFAPNKLISSMLS